MFYDLILHAFFYCGIQRFQPSVHMVSTWPKRSHFTPLLSFFPPSPLLSILHLPPSLHFIFSSSCSPISFVCHCRSLGPLYEPINGSSCSRLIAFDGTRRRFFFFFFPVTSARYSGSLSNQRGCSGTAHEQRSRRGRGGWRYET